MRRKMRNAIIGLESPGRIYVGEKIQHCPVRKLRREYQTRFIVLIVDGASTHTANIIKAYAEDNQKTFRIEILPAYSPELNPTEKSWGFVKSKNLIGILMPL